MGAPLRILTIDDDPSVRRLVSAVLSREGHEVLLAVSGAHGLAMFEAHPVEVAIVDKNLGDMSGFDVIARLREQKPSLAIVLMTALPERVPPASRPDAYLAKPFKTIQSLCDAVTDAVEAQRVATMRREAQRQLDELRSSLSPASAPRG